MDALSVLREADITFALLLFLPEAMKKGMLPNIERSPVNLNAALIPSFLYL